MVISLHSSINHDFSILIKCGDIVIANTEFRAMIMTCSSIEIYIYLSMANNINKLGLTEIRKFKYIVI